MVEESKRLLGARRGIRRRGGWILGLVTALLIFPSGARAQQPAAVPCTPEQPCFGMSFTGSPFSPAVNHDRSFNAKDNLVPRTLVINRGQDVTYHVNGNHWPAVYRPGIDDEDLNATAAPAPGCPSGTRVNDPTGRLFETANCVPNGTLVTVPASVFTTPGQYLVICQIHPHFVGGMYGWIRVQ